MMTLSLLFTIVLPIQADPADRPRSGMPEDWPPLPTFREKVDYLAWFRDRMENVGPDDARPLWNEIDENAARTDEAKAAIQRLWGYDEEGRLPGLLTHPNDTYQTPAFHAWNPQDHPEWEKAYQMHLRGGLRDRLIEISRHKRLSMPLRQWDPNSVERDDGPIDFGITPEDQLSPYILTPTLVSHRLAAKVLIQDAWRQGKDGNIDTLVMIEAIGACLGLGDQIKSSSFIGQLVSVAIREPTYDTVRRALDQDVFIPAELIVLQERLQSCDSDSMMCMDAPYEITYLLDFLQFAYLPADGHWPWPPEPNMANVAKLERYVKAHVQAGDLYDLYSPALDLRGEIDKHDPRRGVQQLIRLERRRRQIAQKHLPQEAGQELVALHEAFKQDPGNHVILRQFLEPAYESWVFLPARGEALRRATHLLVALHVVRAERGSWPEALDAVKGMVNKDVLIDPFSRQPFIYRVNGENMTLYSVGYDGRDNGGKHDRHWGRPVPKDAQPGEGADYVFWPFQRAKP